MCIPHSPRGRFRPIRLHGSIIMSRVPARVVKLSLLRLAEVRQGTYQLLASMLLYPEETVIKNASEAAHQLRRRRRTMGSYAFYTPWESFLRGAETLTPDDVGYLARTYLSFFGGGDLLPVPLHETEYLAPDAVVTAKVLADLESEYSSVGLSASLSEASDHAAVELEYISFLCGQEIEALQNAELPRIVECMEREKHFLERHPCQWLPILARTVNQRGEKALYGLTADAARAMTTHDVDFLETVARHLRLGVELQV